MATEPGAVPWTLPVASETWDGMLNDIDGMHVRTEHVTAALEAASSGPVAEGNVGGGTGMVCHEFKGGIGTASGVLAAGERRLDGRCPGAVQLRGSRPAADRRRAGRRGDRPRRAQQPVWIRAQPDRLARASARGRSSASWPPMRRCSPTSAWRWPSERRSGRRGSAATRRSGRATSSRFATGNRGLSSEEPGHGPAPRSGRRWWPAPLSPPCCWPPSRRSRRPSSTAWWPPRRWSGETGSRLTPAPRPPGRGHGPVRTEPGAAEWRLSGTCQTPRASRSPCPATASSPSSRRITAPC